MDPSIPPKRRGAPKKKLSDAESAALMMSHAALTMAASHGSLPGGSPVRAMSQVLLLLADGDGEGALARLTEHVRRVADSAPEEPTDDRSPKGEE